MPIITIIRVVILVHSRQDNTRHDITIWWKHRFVEYTDNNNENHNDNDNDNHYSMNSHGMKIIS